ncbi:AP-1 complex subunit mu-1 [Perkinsus olseni]|uniref:AP-1 complex subunit mu-1 n=1 Tax=Perkinsus olseni TaxID=32597 RepID=A0A7J6NKX9_PEROL|nr:AP-1 complex subunit mu-1 [Perkinsus olseni]
MSGASAVFILDLKGKVIIWRNYRGEVPPTVTDHFVENVVDADDVNIKPVFVEDGIVYCWIQYNNIFLLAVTQRNGNAMMILSYLYKLADVLKDYFKTVDEDHIKDNFVLTYELLDEMMDNGYPQTTETKILREYIKTEYKKVKVDKMKAPPSAATSAVSWRPEGIKHKKNEIFLDVIEKLNLLVAANGQVLRSEILGSLKMKSFLSGMPECKLGLNDKLLAAGGAGGSSRGGKGVEMEDIKFHQCVRLSRFEQDRTISFIPPDGEFELMSYRLNTPGEASDHCRSGGGPKSIANSVEIHVPVPGDVDTPQCKASTGSVKYHPEKDCVIWSIKQFPGQKDYIMTSNFGLPSVSMEAARDLYAKKPISVKFEIPYFTVSGLTVRYLKIVEKSGYQALPWVRYITQSGDYQLRMT